MTEIDLFLSIAYIFEIILKMPNKSLLKLWEHLRKNL